MKVCAGLGILILILLLYDVFYSNCSYAAGCQTVVYFHSSTCASCKKVDDYFTVMYSHDQNVKILEYEIGIPRYKDLMDRYDKEYNVSVDDAGLVPVVFVGRDYLADEGKILAGLKDELSKGAGYSTVVLDEKAQADTINKGKFLEMRLPGVILAGLVNGINPCSLSMLLFFLSLVLMRGKHIFKTGLSFCAGKFVVFFSLGTLFYGFLEEIGKMMDLIAVKIVLMVLFLLVIVLNVHDLMAVKNEQYGSILLQLPERFRKFNHMVLKKAATLSGSRIFLIICFLLGGLIAVGEFLCTGQVYLATIVTVIHGGQSPGGTGALIYLIVYCVSFVLPLLAISLIMQTGREMFDISEFIREKLYIIKLINIAMFAVFAFIVLVL